MKTILYLLCLLGLSSCVTPLHVSTSHVPPQYEGSRSVLLVEDLPAEANAARKIRELLQQHFPYRYELVRRSDILRNPARYRDTALYRFAILSNVSEGTTLRSTNLVKDYTVIDYHMYDRVTQVHYPATGHPASFAEVPFETLLNTVLKAIKERGKKTPPAYSYNKR
jgi:hypothetical protein